MRRFLFVSVLSLLLPEIVRSPRSKPPRRPIPQKQTRPMAGQPQKARLKIGVALEGGGALGLAHIGVLQWFEDHHIPVDYIAGTSMGGLVGGFYATGKSPKELKEIVEAQDWDIIIGGSTPYEDLSYRRKEDSRYYPNKIVLGLKNGLSLPSGLNAGHQITLLIDRETLALFAIEVLRRVADSLSLRGDGSGERKRRGFRRWLLVAGAARDDVHSRNIFTGENG